MKINIKDEINKSERTVFKLRDIGMLSGARSADNLKSLVNYYVSRGAIRNVRKGVYVKDSYSIEELACRIYSPSYISLETVLQKAGVVFQYSSTLTAVSYLSRAITVDGNEIAYRKIKDSILIESKGIKRVENVSAAIPERAFLDRLYLSKNYYFDNLSPLDENVIKDLLDIYNCKALEQRTWKLFRNG